MGQAVPEGKLAHNRKNDVCLYNSYMKLRKGAGGSFVSPVWGSFYIHTQNNAL